MEGGLSIHAARLRLTLSRVGLLVALIITLHQVTIASPMHGEIMPMAVEVCAIGR